MSTAPPAGRETAGSVVGARQHVRHRPERTLLYRLVEEHYPAFVTRLAAEGRTLPRHVAREFEDFLACGRLEHGFLRVACDGCRAERLVAFSCKRRGFCPSCGARRMAESAALLVDDVFPARPVRQWVLSVPWQLRFLFAHDPAVMGAALGVVNRCITSYLFAKAGLTRDGACTGAVTLIQRFGGALNLNVHFHMLFLDGVYVERPDGTLRFRRIGAPTSTELDELTRTLAHRVGRLLERRGLLERDAEGAWLTGDDGAEAAPIDELRAASITYRVAIGPRCGSKAFTLRTLPPAPDEPLDDQPDGAAGFSLHAGVATGANERAKLERLCRYISRPALSEKRLSLTSGGRVRYRFKTPWRDGTTDVVLDPLDFLARLGPPGAVPVPSDLPPSCPKIRPKVPSGSPRAAGRGGSNVSSASTSRPASSAAGGFGSSPASRTVGSSTRSWPISNVETPRRARPALPHAAELPRTPRRAPLCTDRLSPPHPPRSTAIRPAPPPPTPNPPRRASPCPSHRRARPKTLPSTRRRTVRFDAPAPAPPLP